MPGQLIPSAGGGGDGLDESAVLTLIQSEVSLGDLSDVDLTDLEAGQALVTDGTLWTPGDVAGGGGEEETGFSIGSAFAGGTAGTSFTVTYPEDELEVGDLVIVCAYRNDSGGVAAQASGWGVLVSTSNTRHHAFYKPIDTLGAITASDVFTTNAQTGWTCQIYKGAQAATLLGVGYNSVPSVADLTPYAAAGYFFGSYDGGAPVVSGLVMNASDTSTGCDVSWHRVPLGTPSRDATAAGTSGLMVGVS